MPPREIEIATQRLAQLAVVQQASNGPCTECHWAYSSGYYCQHPGVVEWVHNPVIGEIEKPLQDSSECRASEGVCGPTGKLFQRATQPVAPTKWWRRIFTRSGD